MSRSIPAFSSYSNNKFAEQSAAPKQKEPQWVTDYKNNKLNFIVNGQDVIGLGHHGPSKDFNMLKQFSSLKAKNAILIGIAKTKNIAQDNVSGTISGGETEFYLDQSSGLCYAKITVPSKNVTISTPKPQSQDKKQTQQNQSKTNINEIDRNFDEQNPTTTVKDNSQQAWKKLDREFDN